MRDRTRTWAGVKDSGSPSCASVVSEPGAMIWDRGQRALEGYQRGGDMEHDVLLSARP